MSAEHDSWALGSAEYPWRCHLKAREAASLLRGPMASEAGELAGQGFIVPAPQALERAAMLFEEIARLPGAAPWLKRPAHLDCVQAMVSFANAIEALERELDLDALGCWWGWREGAEVGGLVRAVTQVRDRVNAGELPIVLERFKVDLVRAEQEYAYRR